MVSIWMLTGCGGLFFPDKEGWKYSQKNEFLEILEEDKYLSICNQKRLYNKAKQSRDSRLMTQLLVAYIDNLENGCINLKHFKNIQAMKKENKIETFYETNQKEISKRSIQNQLRTGMSIENILKPYIPTIPQFALLSQKYHILLHNQGNVSKETMDKIRLNIERAKIMKNKVGTHYALINIPEYKVRIVENNHTAMQFAVIVGKANMQTPVFSERLKYVEINPQWNVPDSIMRKSYIPKIMRNPGWVAAKGMEIHEETYDLKSPKVNPASVDWSMYPKDEKGYIPYKLIQVPSLKNGLGRVKFIFPNVHAVYMHDTQNKSLFKRKKRAFSHGCIRLGKPKELLRHITTQYSDQTMQTVQAWYDSLKTKHLILNKPLQVHTAYFTAYVDELGNLRTFNDIYGFDKSQKLNF